MRRRKMSLISVDIGRIKPAKYNPRKELKPDDPEYQRIKRSIEEFGYCEPIIINKDMTCIGGHQRLNVLKDLGKKKIQAIQINVSKSDEKSLNIALNKITGAWDMDKLSDLMNDLSLDDVDLTLTGFDQQDIDLILYPPEKENARENTINGYNLNMYDEKRVDGFYQMPIIKCDDVIPDDLIGFNYMLTSKNKETGIHCYVDDYQFERVWNEPEKYLDNLKEYQCILSPDFSLYMNMPMAMKIWNTYRSRMMGQYWQDNGIKVIATVSWAEPETFTFCYDGIPEGSIVSVSTVGVKRQEESMSIWKQGMDEMIKRIKPKLILVYGGEVDYDYKGTETKFYENKVTEGMKEVKRK